jgi:ABC-2 type transport system ATP-binding protein
LIEVRNLVKKYGRNTAVDNISFTMEHGQIYGLLGPNGAGKSTTMNIMTGYIGATSGDVIINGHNILDEPEEVKKSIGYLPEIPPLYVDMTVSEYLAFAAELKKLPKSERNEAIEKAKEMARVKDVEHRLIKNLSKGYRQRVGLAYAILGLPEIIILDEPTVGLDPKQIIEIREIIRELSEEHIVILSSHILSEVSAVCDYILIMSHGKLVAKDTLANLNSQMESSSYELTLKGEAAAVTDLFENFEDIASYEIEENPSGCTVHFEMDSSDEILEKLFYECASRKLPILHLNGIKRSLEDLFLELTNDSKEVENNDSSL